MEQRVPFLGLDFADLDMDGVLASVALASRSDTWRYVVTPNAAHIGVLSGADRDLWDIYRGAYLCLLDSRVMAGVSRLVGLKPPRVVTGADLVGRLFRGGMAADASICVVGGDASVPHKLRRCFRVGRISHLSPSFGFWRDRRETDGIATFVAQSAADYTLLCVGSPQQEMLAARIAALGTARGVGICAGGSVDFLTGAQRRAPRIMQRLGLEWAFRLATNPRRLAYRYGVQSPLGVLFLLRHAPPVQLVMRGRGRR